jgi:hypothetical protein
MAQVRELLFGTHDPYAGVEALLPFNKFGWNSDAPEFYKYIERIKPKLIIEVGTYFGGSARHMATLAKDFNKDVEIVCIDTFLGSVEHWHNHQYFKPDFFKVGRPPIYEQFISNVIHLGLQKTITPFPIDSINGGLTLQRYDVQADMIYIDGGHEYESITTDLRVFRKLVRPGGILILDDSHYGPIQQAAREQLIGGTITTEGTKIIWTR